MHIVNSAQLLLHKHIILISLEMVPINFSYMTLTYCKKNLTRNTSEIQFTDLPTSDKDIIADSPVHAYFRTLNWFLSLISHLQSGHILHWAPSSEKVTAARKLITSLIGEKLNIFIDNTLQEEVLRRQEI